MLRLLARCDNCELDLLEGSYGAATDLTDENPWLFYLVAIRTARHVFHRHLEPPVRAARQREKCRILSQ